MGLISGKKLGPYEIVSPLGAGGMGEVYRARDTQLGRDVALKVLPEILAHDPERMARFKREAQVLASLNHPNIATIYGFEESDGLRALVMELVEGPTLAEGTVGTGLAPSFGEGTPRGAPTPRAMQADEVLAIAKQIAEGLEYAHDRGIIHRDLKPANIKITPDGAVKILDFGLAKALESDASVSSAVSNSPTLTVAATQAGIILGTAAYMSPEQAKGKPADRRADIWAFGCVLYEMLTGQRAFEGETVSDVLAGVIRAEPDWRALPSGLPPRVLDLVHRCLVKDPKHRLQAIGDARITIEETMAGGTGVSPVAMHGQDAHATTGGDPFVRQGRLRSPLQRVLPWAVAGLLLVLSVLLGVGFVLRAPKPPPSIRASISLPDGATQPPLGYFSISPDGLRLAFVAAPSGGRPQLWVRPLDSMVAQPLTGTEGAAYPFWSPDSRSIAFFAEGKLKKIDASGGPAQVVCDAAEGRGGAWGPNGIIVFAPGVFSGIFQVAAIGGTPAQLTTPASSGDSDRFPSFLPDGKHVLFFSLGGGSKKDRLRVVSLASKEVKTVADINSNAVYDPSGYLLYQRDGNLVAQRFDPDSLSLSGDAFPVVEQIQSDPDKANAFFSVSSNGILVFQSGKFGNKAQLTWFDRDGKRIKTLGEPADLFFPALSPDGKRVVAPLSGPGGKSSLWMLDVTRGVLSRFSFSDFSDSVPVWSPDGKEVAYESNRGGNLEIFIKPASGVESEKPLVTGEGESMPTDWSRDGRYIAYQTQSQKTKKFDIWILPMTGDRKPYPFIATEANEWGGTFSPDGRWLAYISDESGRNEVYVVPFPGRGGKWQVSSSGGETVFWVADGKELDYFTQDGKWMAVEVNGKGNEFSVGATKAVFDGKSIPGAIGRGVWVTSDGKRLLVPVPEGTSAVPFTLNTNWRAQFKK
jgi:eukaryotic-like serine/threonine-protein kinase